MVGGLFTPHLRENLLSAGLFASAGAVCLAYLPGEGRKVAEEASSGWEVNAKGGLVRDV